MKFAHQLKEVLRREGFPPHWVESAVPYSQLKKCIKKIEEELRSFGLDTKTLRQLLHSYPTSGKQNAQKVSGDVPIAFQYYFADDQKAFRPKLTLYILLEDGMTIDASLSPRTKKFLQDLAVKQGKFQPGFMACFPNKLFGDDVQCISETQRLIVQGEEVSELSDVHSGSVIRRLEIPLTFDVEFFGLLQGDVSILDKLQAGEEKAMADDIKNLGREISRITNPTRTNKHDLDRWREMFDLYLQANIFFSTHELDHGSRESTGAVKQLQWFQDEVTKRDLAKSFKLTASQKAFSQFVDINVTLLRNLKFQEINQLAVSKILKSIAHVRLKLPSRLLIVEFDKRTSLGAKNTFPKMIQSNRILSETIAKAVCAEISSEIVKVVPQLDDYLCPVCFSISYKPIRLTCGHVFCIRCMIRMQRSRAKFCPLCRNDVVLSADSANLDIALMNFLQRYFPKETKAKQKENEFAVAVDQWGEGYANTRCMIM